MFNHFGKLFSIALAALALSGTQSALGWGTSPSAGANYSWNQWGSKLQILFEGEYLEAISAEDRLQVELLSAHVQGDDYCSDSTSADTPCLWLHGQVPACIDSDLNGCDYGIDTVVLAELNVSIDPVAVTGNLYTAAGKKTHVDGNITCLTPPNGTDFDACPPEGFPAAVGLPKGGNFNKIFPAISVLLQGETVDLAAGQLVYLEGPLDQPKGPVLRHCFEQGKEPGTGVVDCGTPQYLRTAQGEIPPFIGGLDFESTTTNLNIGKNADSFAIHVNLLSQTNAEGLAFIPEQIDFSKSLAIGGFCEPVLGQISWGDYNKDGITDVRLRYDAGCLAGLSEVTSTPDGGTVDLAISGTLLDGVQFEGTFSVTVNQ